MLYISVKFTPDHLLTCQNHIEIAAVQVMCIIFINLSGWRYEALLIKAANGDIYESELEVNQESVFNNDLDFDRLKKHLGVLADV